MARKSRKQQPESDASYEVYRTAIYARLSREAQEQETIEAQIDVVRKYIENRHIFQLVDVYADNGYSGTNFQRPAFQRLMEDLRNGKINCIIVKDLSRFAREHIGAEDYLNNIFPFLGVRFIAINDDYDNTHIEPQEYFLASFKNLVHAYFAQETSRKVSMAKHSLQEQGKYIGSKPPFGYIRDPEDKHKLIPDAEAAPVIREIFERAAKGETIRSICEDFNQRGLCDLRWTSPRIYAILKREVYKGTLVQRHTVTALYKNEKIHAVPKEEQIRIENGVSAIVTPEIWEKVQKILIDRNPQMLGGHAPNPYRGLTVCGHCGKKIAGEYRPKHAYFVFFCKAHVYATNIVLDCAVRKYLNLTEDAEITSDILHNAFDRIIVFDRETITFQDKGGESK